LGLYLICRKSNSSILLLALIPRCCFASFSWFYIHGFPINPHQPAMSEWSFSISCCCAVSGQLLSSAQGSEATCQAWIGPFSLGGVHWHMGNFLTNLNHGIWIDWGWLGCKKRSSKLEALASRNFRLGRSWLASQPIYYSPIGRPIIDDSFAMSMQEVCLKVGYSTPKSSGQPPVFRFSSQYGHRLGWKYG
jgi:hypothetical protein